MQILTKALQIICNKKWQTW